MDRHPPANLAAIVYDDGAVADALLHGFARELLAAGEAVQGLVQLPHCPPGQQDCGPMALQDLGSGAVLSICQDLGAGASGCRLDGAALADAAQRLRDAAERPSRLLVVSKFGKQEAGGGGFRDGIAHAVAEGRCVLTAVKRSLLPDWQEFTGGDATLLPPDAAALRQWWANQAGG